MRSLFSLTRYSDSYSDRPINPCMPCSRVIWKISIGNNSYNSMRALYSISTCLKWSDLGTKSKNVLKLDIGSVFDSELSVVERVKYHIKTMLTPLGTLFGIWILCIYYTIQSVNFQYCYLFSGLFSKSIYLLIMLCASFVACDPSGIEYQMGFKCGAHKPLIGFSCI